MFNIGNKGAPRVVADVGGRGDEIGGGWGRGGGNQATNSWQGDARRSQSACFKWKGWEYTPVWNCPITPSRRRVIR